ncbi:hypothetical protein [Paenibacillus sp. GYB003]|uniref:hypothetical protein n=1 Tax=Paenibacillus sp. GYB003 TaxID=2994392 RepID=UPI002F96852B
MTKISKVSLDRLRFSGLHKSHIGAIKSCLDYWNVPHSVAWVYGITGNAFLSVVDERMTAPNRGEPEPRLFEAARHLGLSIEGFYTIAADDDSFRRLQAEAWDGARNALRRGLPVFAKQLDLGDETSMVYAFDDTGYYTHSWHGGTGHEGADDVIPWMMLGRSYCPCAACAADRSNERHRSDRREPGGFISLHWADKAEPSDDASAIRAALELASEFSRDEAYEWDGQTFYGGIRALDRWIEAVRGGTIECFFMGYYVDLFHESRHYAQRFLREAGDRLGGSIAERLDAAAEHYGRIAESFRTLNGMFPWMQPREPLLDPDRREQASELLVRIRELEIEGRPLLERIRSLL